MARNKPRALKDIHRAFLVQEFACFADPKEAADALRDKYGIEIAPQSAQHYDAMSWAGKRAAKKWHELFSVARKAFINDVEARIPEVHKAVRIQELARASRTFKKNGNLMAMANMLERIAKEMGNFHTNRYEFTGKDRGPIKFQDIDAMTDEQIDDELRTYGFDPDIHPMPKSTQ